MCSRNALRRSDLRQTDAAPPLRMLENLRFDRNSVAIQRLFFLPLGGCSVGYTIRLPRNNTKRVVLYKVRKRGADRHTSRPRMPPRAYENSEMTPRAHEDGSFAGTAVLVSGGRAGRAAVCNFMRRGACDERSCFFCRHLVRHNGSARTGRIRFLPPLPFALSNLCLHIARACDIIFRGGARSAASYSQ